MKESSNVPEVDSSEAAYDAARRRHACHYSPLAYVELNLRVPIHTP
jgi:hypothetical protein